MKSPLNDGAIHPPSLSASHGRAAIAIGASVVFVALAGCSKKPAPAPSQGATNIVFTDSSGRTLRDEDVDRATGTFKWEVRGGNPVPAEAAQLHEKARKAGSAGKFEECIACLENAAKLAPDWPYPPYDQAWTYLLMGNSVRALEYYRKVDAMAPLGFFTTKTAIDCLEREAAGSIAAGSYVRVVQIEGVGSASRKIQILDEALRQSPEFPFALKERALLESAGPKRSEFLEKALTLNPDPETRGILLINKANDLANAGKTQEAIDILGTLALDPKSTGTTIELAKWSLGRIRRGK